MNSLPNGNEITRMESEAKAIAAAPEPDREAASALLTHVGDMLDTNDHYGRRLRAIRQLLMSSVRDADADVDAEAAGLGRKVAEALEAAGTRLLGETERLIIYRVLRTAAPAIRRLPMSSVRADTEAAGLARKVAEALEAVDVGGETERLIIYRVLRTAALFNPTPVATPAT